MPLRHLLTLAFALFFAAFVPLALACELSASGAVPRSELDCSKAPEVLECATSDALGSAPPPKGSDDGPRLQHLYSYSVPLPLPVWILSQLPSGAYRAHIAPLAHKRSTLFGQAVLLLI